MTAKLKPTKREIKASLAYYAAMSDSVSAREKFPSPRPARTAARVARKAATPLEKDVQREIMRALRGHRLVAEVTRHNSGRFGDKGQYRFNSSDGHADIAGLLHGGKAFFVEVKRENGLLTEAQAMFLLRRFRAGARCGVARHVPDAIEIVEGRYTLDKLKNECVLAKLPRMVREIEAMEAE